MIKERDEELGKRVEEANKTTSKQQELEKLLQESQNALSNKENLVQELQNGIESKTDTINSLQSAQRDWASERSTLQTEHDEIKREILRVNSDYDAENRARLAAENALQDVEDKRNKIEEDAISARASLHTHLDLVTKHISTLGGSVEDIVESRRGTEDSGTDLAGKASKAKGKGKGKNRATSTAEQNSLSGVHEMLVAAHGKLEGLLSDRDSEVQKLRKELHLANEQRESDSDARVNALIKELADAQEEFDLQRRKLTDGAEQLQARINDSDAKLSILVAQSEDDATSIRDLRASCEERDGTIMQLRSQISDTEDKARENAEQAKLQSDRLQSELEDAMTALSTAQNEADAARCAFDAATHLAIAINATGGGGSGTIRIAGQGCRLKPFRVDHQDPRGLL